MNAEEQDRMLKLLQQVLPPIEDDAELARDLWPIVLKKLDGGSEAPPWYDWAMVVSLVALVALFPASIPVFLYYL